MKTLPFFLEQFTDQSGKPLSNGSLTFLVAGSSSIPKDIYTDYQLTTKAANPFSLDSVGRAPQYYVESGMYKIVVKDQSGSIIATRDYVEGDNSTSGTPTVLDYKVKTNTQDSTPGFLVDKIVDSATIITNVSAAGFDNKMSFSINYAGLTGISGTPIGPAGGDLSGTYPAPIIKQITGAGTSIPVHNRLDCEQGISISADSYLKSLTSAAILGTDATGKIISADTTPFLSGKTRVSNTDGYPDYLENKLQPYIGIAIDRAGSTFEFLNFTSLGYVCVGAGDTVHQRVLDEKLLPGNGINFSIVNNPPYGNQIAISATNDGIVKTYPSDISASYLSNKLIAGAGITITSASDVNGTKMILNAKGNSWRLLKYIAANYTVLDTDDTLIIRGTANITLPTPSSQYEGRIITVRSAGSFVCSILGSIVGGTSLGVYQKYEYICYNTGSAYFWVQQ